MTYPRKNREASIQTCTRLAETQRETEGRWHNLLKLSLSKRRDPNCPTTSSWQYTCGTTWSISTVSSLIRGSKNSKTSSTRSRAPLRQKLKCHHDFFFQAIHNLLRTSLLALFLHDRRHRDIHSLRYDAFLSCAMHSCLVFLHDWRHQGVCSSIRWCTCSCGSILPTSTIWSRTSNASTIFSTARCCTRSRGAHVVASTISSAYPPVAPTSVVALVQRSASSPPRQPPETEALAWARRPAVPLAPLGPTSSRLPLPKSQALSHARRTAVVHVPVGTTSPPPTRLPRCPPCPNHRDINTLLLLDRPIHDALLDLQYWQSHSLLHVTPARHLQRKLDGGNGKALYKLPDKHDIAMPSRTLVKQTAHCVWSSCDPILARAASGFPTLPVLMPWENIPNTFPVSYRHIVCYCDWRMKIHLEQTRTVGPLSLCRIWCPKKLCQFPLGWTWMTPGCIWVGALLRAGLPLAVCVASTVLTLFGWSPACSRPRSTELLGEWRSILLIMLTLRRTTRWRSLFQCPMAVFSCFELSPTTSRLKRHPEHRILHCLAHELPQPCSHVLCGSEVMLKNQLEKKRRFWAF